MQIGQQIRKHIGLTSGQESALRRALILAGMIAVGMWTLRSHVAFLGASQRYEHAMGEHEEMSEVVNEDLAAQRRKLERLREERAVFAGMAFRPAEARQFHHELQDLCREAACDIVSLSYSKDENLASYGERDAASTMVLRRTSLTVHGLYGGVVQVLDALQKRPQKVWVEGFHMQILQAKPGWVSCDMKVVIWVDCQTESL